ncbi:sulfotransferase family protein [Alkalibacillus almallahensis]|uniref:sulfotransferase family protein n=1 Tax=Alkalibacillus almallahensis TaxID=1379154 RepID=UPI001423E274|nr:sulfotransferase [Alkalibacillus almallahensis]NIK12507.1 hypothetical protein [Alkalibacillus almallahensis]
MNKEKGMVFIGGAGRSGTTLLRVMLNAHPEMCSGPEFKLLPNLINGYKQLGRMVDIRKSYYLDDSKLNESYRALINTFFENFLEQNNASRVVEKTPHNVLIMQELANILPDSKFIHIVRDGRDVVSSLIDMEWKDSSGETIWYVKNVENATKYWVQVVEQGLKSAESSILKDRIKLIKYEDLILNPQNTMEDILKFLGERWDDRVMEHETQNLYSEPVESSTSQVSQKRYTKAIGKWQEKLDEKEKEIFYKQAGHLLKTLGYE